MKAIITLFCLAITTSIFAQKEISLNSSIKDVTVFFQGAQVFQSQKTLIPKGRQLIVFEKLTDFLDPNSVQVKATGDLTILSVKTRKNFEDLKLSNSEVDELTTRRKKLETRETLLSNEYGILSLDSDLLMRNRDLKGNEKGLSVAELKEAYSFMHTKLAEIISRQTEIETELEALSKEINRIDQEILSVRSKPVVNYTEVVIEIEAEKQTNGEFFISYITPKASWTPYYDLRSDGIGQPILLQAKANVSQTTGIEWNDVRLVLSTNDPYENTKEPEIKPWGIYYYNQPQQKQHYSRQVPTYDYSGEKLRGEAIDAATSESLPFTKITFPGFPNVGAITDFDGKFEIVIPKGATTVKAEYIGYGSQTLPINSPYLKFFLAPDQLQIDEVVISSKSIERIPSVSAENDISGIFAKREKRKNRSLAEPKYAPAPVNANYANTVATTVVQKDLRVEYTIESTFTIPSNGQQQRVSISEYTLPAQYEYHSVPKLDPSVYLVANTSGWEKLNLLNGESNLYFDGTYIGKTYVDANSLKDTLTFSLGKDNKMQIERTRISEKSTNRVFGSRRKFEVAWEINVKNNGGASIPLMIKDQFPFSTDADIKIKYGDHVGAVLDDKTYILTWKTTTSPSTKQSFTFDYKVEYDANKALYLE